ncbi:hypothetical protein BH10BAC2_BH10BAC2_27570 [soil metagenome]
MFTKNITMLHTDIKYKAPKPKSFKGFMQKLHALYIYRSDKKVLY